MTPEQENFDGLRRLLKLKRYEPPPPGYFNDFSRQVMVRIKADTIEDREHPLDRISWEVPWLQRLIEAFQAKPVLAVSFGTAVCLLLVGGVIYSESMEYKPATLPALSADATLMTPVPVASSAFGLNGAGEGTLVLASTNNGMNSLVPAAGSLFDQFQINPQPVSFQLRGNGK